jgi:hypothetical protein
MKCMKELKGNQTPKGFYHEALAGACSVMSQHGKGELSPEQMGFLHVLHGRTGWF